MTGLEPTEYADLFDDVIAKLRFERLSRGEQFALCMRIVLAERERCAALCDGSAYDVVKDIAEKIRERSGA